MRRAVVLGLILLALPARADPTAGDILRRPLAPYGTDYLSGLTDGIEWVNAKKGGERLFCPPRSVAIQPAQYADILRRKVEADPALANAHAGYVMLLAMVDAFPCPVKP